MYNNIHINENGDSEVENSHKALEDAVEASSIRYTDFIECTSTGRIYNAQSGSHLCAECLNYMKEHDTDDTECNTCVEDSFRR
jgi:hypothetical protein